MCMYVLTQWCSLSGSVPRWCSSGLTSSAAMQGGPVEAAPSEGAWRCVCMYSPSGAP
jgi:hypothetical protein